MMARGDKGSFLAAHYDWLLAGVGVLALAAAAVIFFGTLGDDPEETAAGAVRAMEARKPSQSGVKPVDLAEYARVAKQAKTPSVLGEVTEKAESFLASGRRLFCANANCRKPIPGDAKNCPYCNAQQAEEEKVVLDADADGLPDEWEKRYGLNPNDAADAASDRDADGFTNLEEFEAKTDPTDPDAHPDYLDSLKLALPLKETLLPFFFERMLTTPSGVKFYFKDLKAKSGWSTGSTTLSVLQGEAIGKSGFVVRSFEKKTKKVAIKGSNVQREVDVSTVTLERTGDRKTIVLALGEKRKPVDIQAKLVYSRGERKEFVVVPGDTLQLHRDKYVVKSIAAEGKKSVVVLEHATSGKTREVVALEP